MFKRITSAAIVAMLVLCAVSSVSAQDTTKVMMLVGDTSHYFSTYFEPEPCSDSISKLVLCGKDVKEDKGNKGIGQCFWIIGYAVKTEKEEGYPPTQIQNGKEVIVGKSFVVHRTYYDMNWRELPSCYYIWMAVSTK